MPIKERFTPCIAVESCTVIGNSKEFYDNILVSIDFSYNIGQIVDACN